MTADPRFTKSGQPKMGARFVLKVGRFEKPVKIVAKLWGRKGSADLIGIVFEYEDGERSLPCHWPEVGGIMR